MDKKYVRLMGKYLEQVKPNVGNAWRTDELFLKVKGDMKYLYALMDDQTRFWIAQQVANTKKHSEYKSIISNILKEVTDKRPNSLISDGAPNFNDHHHNNNKTERRCPNGEVRYREKTTTGLKKPDTPIVSGYQIFHNYVRPHEGSIVKHITREIVNVKTSF